MQPARHEVVARAFGRARGQNRRLNSRKPCSFIRRECWNHLRPQDDVAVNPVAPQIQETVPQPLLLRNVLRARDLERQRVGVESTSSSSTSTSTAPVGNTD
jgi:hypothetical protein